VLNNPATTYETNSCSRYRWQSTKAMQYFRKYASEYVSST